MRAVVASSLRMQANTSPFSLSHTGQEELGAGDSGSFCSSGGGCRAASRGAGRGSRGPRRREVRGAHGGGCSEVAGRVRLCCWVRDAAEPAQGSGQACRGLTRGTGHEARVGRRQVARGPESRRSTLRRCLAAGEGRRSGKACRMIDTWYVACGMPRTREGVVAGHATWQGGAWSVQPHLPTANSSLARRLHR